jgi:hypothetical protein
MFSSLPNYIATLVVTEQSVCAIFFVSYHFRYVRCGGLVCRMLAAERKMSWLWK